MKATPLFVIAVLAAFSTFAQAPVVAQTAKSRVPPRALFQAMLDSGREQGWIQFRNFGGNQLVYFTPLQSLHCRLKEIRYSINSKDLDRRFPLVKCNPQNPFALPPDAGLEAIAISLEPGTARTVAVQVVWEDDALSPVAIYEPCEDVGDQSCAWPLE